MKCIKCEEDKPIENLSRVYISNQVGELVERFLCITCEEELVEMQEGELQ